MVNSNIAIGSMPTLQTSHGLLALFEKIYYREPIFIDFSNIGEDVQYHCFNEVYDVKSVSQPDTLALLGTNYSLQIIKTGFAEQFYASHRMGPAPICLKISARTAERETCRMIPLKTGLFSHWSIPLTFFSLKF
jgi:hypothetical protein